MARMVKCHQARPRRRGARLPALPGRTRKRIYENVSKEAWQAWIKHQTMLINENKLNLADPRARKYLASRWRSTSSGREPTWLRATCRRTSRLATSG